MSVEDRTGTDALLLAAEHADWMQVVLNQGPPCFHYEADRQRFCLRAERWAGHRDGDYPYHAFVPLHRLLATLTAKQPDLASLAARWREKAETPDYTGTHSDALIECADDLAALRKGIVAEKARPIETPDSTGLLVPPPSVVLRALAYYANTGTQPARLNEHIEEAKAHLAALRIASREGHETTNDDAVTRSVRAEKAPAPQHAAENEVD